MEMIYGIGMISKKGAKGGTTHRIEGGLTGFRANHKGGESLIGWALDRTAGGRPIVDICVGDKLIVTARPTAFRPTRLGIAASLYGFRADLPQNFACGETITFVARARLDAGWVEIGRFEARRSPGGKRVDGAAMPLALAEEAIEVGEAPSAVAIVLTQDGAEVLLDLLNSIMLHELGSFRRIVVVDHGSTDDTERVVGEFAKVLPLTLLKEPRARSFSQSNNLAARQADEDVLVFINNDIVFTEPCVRIMTRQLSPDVGLVGLRLMDPPIETGPAMLRAAQHLGIHFAATAGAVVPFESRELTDAPGANAASITVPAVTAAFVAIRRGVFESLGGFDERYEFGMEDVDLALRSLASGRRNICVNGHAAIHVGSVTRRRSARASTKRNRRNERHFNARWGEELRAWIIRDRFERPGFWAGRSVHIGFVTPRVMEARIEPFGRALCEVLPAKVFLYPPISAIDARDIDVLAVLDCEVDVRTIAVGATAQVVAIVEDQPETWAARPWRGAFSTWFAATDTADDLAARLKRPVTPFTLDEPHAPATFLGALRDPPPR